MLIQALLNYPGLDWGRSDADGQRYKNLGYTLAVESQGLARVLEAVMVKRDKK